MANSKLPPNSQAFEEAVLGSILIAPEVLPEVTAILTEHDFFFVSNRYIWQAIQRVVAAGNQVDNITVVDELQRAVEADGTSHLSKIGGAGFISYLINSTASYINAASYARGVERLAVRRRLLEATGKIAALALDDSTSTDEIIAKAPTLLASASKSRYIPDNFTPVQDSVKAYIADLESRYNAKENAGFATGLHGIDAMCGGGLQRNELIFIAARPGTGKTALVSELALRLAKAKARVSFITLEMTPEQIIGRMLGRLANVDGKLMRAAKSLSDDDLQRIFDATAMLDELPLNIMMPAGKMSIENLAALVRRQHQERGLDVLFIDHLALLDIDSGRNSSDYVQALGDATWELQQLALHLKIVIICATQLNRAVEARSDKRPAISDIRSSGRIEENATQVWLLYRDSMYNDNSATPNSMEVIFGKNRYGAMGTVNLAYYPVTQAIENEQRVRLSV